MDVAVGIDLWGEYASVMATGARGNGASVMMTAQANLKACSEVETTFPLDIQLIQADAFQVRPPGSWWPRRSLFGLTRHHAPRPSPRRYR